MKKINSILKIKFFLMENYNLDEDTSIKISEEILQIFKKHNLTLPTETNIKEIDLHDDKTLKVIYKSNKKENIKIGKLLLNLFPDLQYDEKKLLNIVNDIKKIIINKIPDISLTNYIFEIRDHDISSAYYDAYCAGITSCVVNQYDFSLEEALQFYDVNPDIKLLLLKNKSNSKILGRALIWNKVNGNRTFIDRFYGDKSYFEIIKIWAKKNNYLLKAFDKEEKKVYDFSKNENKPIDLTLTYKIPSDVIEKIEYIPYLDTLCFCDLNFILSNKYTANTIYDFTEHPVNILAIKNPEELTNENYFDIELCDYDDFLEKTYTPSLSEDFRGFYYQNFIDNKLFKKDKNIKMILIKHKKLNRAIVTVFSYAYVWYNTNLKKPIVGFYNEIDSSYFSYFNNKKILDNLREIAYNKFTNFIKEKKFLNINNIDTKIIRIYYNIDINILKEINYIHKDWIDFFEYFAPAGYLATTKEEDNINIYNNDLYYKDIIKINIFNIFETKKWSEIFNFFYKNRKININFEKALDKFFKTGYNNKDKNLGSLIYLKNDTWDKIDEEFEGFIVNSTWKDGIFKNGLMYKVEINNGIIINGSIYNSIIKKGHFKNADIFNSIVNNITTENNKIINSLIKNSSLGNSYISNCVIKNCELKNGFIGSDVTWEGGTFYKKSYWSDKNNWKYGKIECKKYENKFIFTRIDPNEFWKLEEESENYEDFIKKLKEKEKRGE